MARRLVGRGRSCKLCGMKLFSCDHCQQTLYFENSLCVSCGGVLAPDPAYP